MNPVQCSFAIEYYNMWNSGYNIHVLLQLRSMVFGVNCNGIHVVSNYMPVLHAWASK